MDKLSTGELILDTIKEFKKENREAHITLTKHVEKTNGRVKSLEVWRGFLAGGMAVLSILIPVLFKIFN